MRLFNVLLAVSLAHVPMSLQAETTGASECSQIDDDMTRLACYDELFGRTVAAAEAVDDIDAGAEVPRRVESESPAAVAVATGLGADQVREANFETVESRLVGDFTGWSGRTVFTLENGQVWRQTKNYIRDYTPREPITQPKVTISRGFFSSYNMRIEGVKRLVQVRRIK